MLRRDTISLGLIFTPILLSRASASSLALFQSIILPFLGMRPKNMFSTTDKLGIRLISWYTVANPLALASAVLLKRSFSSFR